MSYKEKVLNVYDGWYENNRSVIENEQWNLIDQNILLHPEKDNLRGLNILSFLPEDINETINTKLKPRLESVISDSGWFFPDKARHFTVLDIIPHNSGLSVQDIEKSKMRYADVVSKTLEDFNIPVLIGLEGVFASPDGVTIQGFPANDGLPKLRERLRNNLSTEGLINLEGKKYHIETAHIAIVKFVRGLRGSELLELVDDLRQVSLGSFTAEEMILNISPRYDKTKTIEIVKRYSLSL